MAAAIVLVLAWMVGLTLNALTLGVLVHVLVGIVRRVVAAVRRRLDLGWLRCPLAHRAQFARCLVNCTLLLVVAVVQHVSIVPGQLGEDYSLARLLLGSCIVIAALLELVPVAPPRSASTAIAAIVTIFLGVQLLMILREPDQHVVVLDPPMAEELLVMQGGQSPLINHHYIIGSQRHAVDLVVVVDGRIRVTGAEENHAFACFGKIVLAPAAGRIVRAIDTLPDMPPGEQDRANLIGNHVVLELGPRRYVLLAHLRSGSIRVKAGDQIASGQPLAECGNSGNTSEPHLHIQVQDRPEYSDDVVTFPIAFRHVVRGGVRASAPIAVRRKDHLLKQ